MFNKSIIAAARNEDDFYAALKSKVDAIFLIKSSIASIDGLVTEARKAAKPLFVHIDMADGIGKDKAGVRFLVGKSVGIISTKTNLISYAAELGAQTVQRFFAIDSMSISSANEAIRSAKPTYAEIMPGLMPKILKRFNSPVIAGGLINDISDVRAAFEGGAVAVSTSEKSLWNMRGI